MLKTKFHTNTEPHAKYSLIITQYNKTKKKKKGKGIPVQAVEALRVARG
jgi:hypothetical protein